jgi:hypothetical protein
MSSFNEIYLHLSICINAAHQSQRASGQSFEDTYLYHRLKSMQWLQVQLSLLCDGTPQLPVTLLVLLISGCMWSSPAPAGDDGLWNCAPGACIGAI